jgi:hypothetical protein
MGLKLAAPVVVFLIRPAKDTFAVFPFMLCPAEKNIPRIILKDIANRIFTRGVFGTIHGAPGQVSGQFGNGYAIKLVFEDMIYPVMQIGDFFFKAPQEPLGYLPQEYAGL